MQGSFWGRIGVAAAVMAIAGCDFKRPDEDAAESALAEPCADNLECSPNGLICAVGTEKFICLEGQFDPLPPVCTAGERCSLPGSTCLDACGQTVTCDPTSVLVADPNDPVCDPNNLPTGVDSTAVSVGAATSGTGSPGTSCVQQHLGNACTIYGEGSMICGPALTCHCGIWTLTENANTPCGTSGAGGTGGASGTSSSSSSSASSSSSTSSSSASSSSASTSAQASSSASGGAVVVPGCEPAVGTVIGACSTDAVPAGMVHFCYVADAMKSIGQYGPFELQFDANPPGSAIYDCWETSPGYTTAPCSTICPDTNTADSVLECLLPFPAGTQDFLFQVEKPASAFWWGDQAYYAQGGCGADNGTVVLTGPGGVIGYTRVPNSAGPEFLNGFVDAVP